MFTHFGALVEVDHEVKGLRIEAKGIFGPEYAEEIAQAILEGLAILKERKG